MTNDEAAPDGVTVSETGSLPFDTSVAHQARGYNYVLGGKDHYAADRALVEAAQEVWPDLVFALRANRAFLGRVVRYLTAEAGIRQFLDIGTGIPQPGNTHEVAQSIAPEAHVVYVDYDPVVLAHARALLTSHEAGATEYIHADLRDTDTILTQAAQLLDLTKPVAITLLAILHVIPDSDDPHAIVARLMNAVPPGSCLAISHAGSDLLSREAQEGLTEIGNRMSQQQLSARNREEVARFFAGMDIVEPGLVPIEDWRPEPGPAAPGKSAVWGAVGRRW
jgi:trans-aconitate methyltransferase